MAAVYRHTQTSRTASWVLVGAFLLALWVTMRTAHPIPAAVAVLLGCFLMLFSSLTVEVDEETVEVSFGVGVIRRNIPLRRITHVEAVRNPWYYGWGIRLTPHGWLWNVSGFGAVQLTFADGHHFRIGSDEPDHLAEVLKSQVAGR